MQKQKKVHTDTKGKDAPRSVAASNEERTKQKTEPLENNDHSTDQREGRMNNGELGGGLRKEDE